jgi:hypothetical protein
MNRGEIRDAVKQRMAIPSTGDGQLTDAVLNGLINQALTVISGEHDWPWLLTSTTVTFSPSTASLPSDFIKSRALIYNTLPVQWVQLEDFLDPDRFFAPFSWTIIGATAQVTPAPTSNIATTLYYYRREPDLSADGSTPLMPSLFHNLIVAYTTYLAAMVRQDEGRAAVHMADYNMLLNNMRDDLTQSTTRRIRYDRSFQYATWQ